jgi:3D (Asp-Asp-Asp) domain-containing protein
MGNVRYGRRTNMKKITLLTVLAMTLGLSAPMMPQAQAASVVEQIVDQAISHNFTGAKAQDLQRVKQDIEKGNRDDLIGMLAQTAIEKLSIRNQSPAAAKNALAQQVVEKVGDKVGLPPEGRAVIMHLLQNTILTPQVVRDSNSLIGPPTNFRKVLNMAATGYAPGRSDNGHWNDVTYIGSPIRHGVVAVDPKVIPLGSRVWVEGYGSAIAEDEGSAIVGNRIDLAFNTRQEALNYGIQPVKVYVL